MDEALVTAMPAFLDLSGNGDGQSVIGAMGSGTDYFFNGLIDDVRVYDRAIDEADIPKLNKPAGIDTTGGQAFAPMYLHTPRLIRVGTPLL